MHSFFLISAQKNIPAEKDLMNGQTKDCMYREINLLSGKCFWRYLKDPSEQRNVAWISLKLILTNIMLTSPYLSYLRPAVPSYDDLDFPLIPQKGFYPSEILRQFPTTNNISKSYYACP